MPVARIPSTPTAFASSQRILVLVLMAALVPIGVALAMVSRHPLGVPAAWVPLAQVGLGIAVALMIRLATSQTPALDPSLSEDRAHGLAQERYQAAVLLRFALSESVAIISIALGFALQEEALLLTYVGGAVVSLVLMWLFVFPSRSTVASIADRLEAQGADSGLRQEFGHASGPGSTPGGAIQEL